MRRSEIQQLIREATIAFQQGGWALPMEPRWDVTDFGLGDWRTHGLVLINLAEEAEYCEKLMYARAGMTTPAHTHKIKKEDIIARKGTLRLWLWNEIPRDDATDPVIVNVDGKPISIAAGKPFDLVQGSRVTLLPGTYHTFAPATHHCIIGEVSTANDDANDNHFANPEVGRFPGIEEDEPASVRLVSEN